MTEKQSLSAQSIIDCLNANYGIAVASLTLLPLGADMNASVYKAETQGSQSYFVKLKRGHRYDMSVAILALLQSFRNSTDHSAYQNNQWRANSTHQRFHSYCIPICRWTEWILL